MPTDEKKIAIKMAKSIAFLCTHNSCLNYMRKGTLPVSKTGAYDDVKIIDADGNEHTWDKIARISQVEHKKLIENIVNALYDFLLNVETEEYTERLERAYDLSSHWKNPKEIKKQ